MEELLSIKLRPKSLKDIIGQEHLVGENKVIYNLVKNKKLFSMILYGHPGIGKTSIATAIAEELGMRYRNLNAVVNNKKDFDTVIEEAKLYDGLIVIVDEIHRLNKDKQDILLPYLESGIITLIGMTTSNPYHAINPAIRSRCQLFELKDLTSDDIKKGIDKAVESNYLEGLTITDEAKNYLASISGTDLRYAYNTLEVAYYSTEDKNITLDTLSNLSYVNKFHLVHLFTKQMGTSPINYLINKRIEEAKNLLTTTNHSIRDISTIVGFSNSSYFSQMFKKTTGDSPRSYKNLYSSLK